MHASGGPFPATLRQIITGICFAALLVNTAYIAAFASPTLFYMGNVVLHLLLGIALLVAVASLERGVRVTLLSLSALAGLGLIAIGNTRPHVWLLALHIVLGAAFVLAAIGWLNKLLPGWRPLWSGAAAVLLLFPLLVRGWNTLYPNPDDRIRNPAVVPVSMNEEGGGPKSPFWPSSSRTNTGGTIPSTFFMDSDTCGECHRDIYQQWKSSVHHFASFNNQFYRKSIEYMQSVNSVQSTKWCAGCHDHAVFFNGRFERPIKEQIDTPEAQNGLGCVSCHSIVHVDSSMGNGGFTIEYPPLHELASSKNQYLRAVDRFLTYLNPAPHRKVFMKPFMRQDSPEFCAGCHKVHLDTPVNNYRWLRGFNDYDNWQASGVSGQGARSFYYPPKSATCADCHMPKVASQDPGNRDGTVHSHRFAAANMAVAYANQDAEQMKAVEANLKSGFITVDLFSATPITKSADDIEVKRRAQPGPQIASTFAVGEESEQSGNVFLREVGNISAPIDRAHTTVQPGSDVRVDAVVRTRKIGHFFPGGTVDSFDVWLELQAVDATGKIIFWSGGVTQGGKGPVEAGAHFYRSYQLDAQGNPINKRNAFQTRSTLYVRLIPPGAADVVHYRIHVPKDAKGPVTISAKLNYRKFSHYYTQYVYAGEPKPGQDPHLVAAGYDNREFSFFPANIPTNVSGVIKGRIPDLPVLTLATSTTKLNLGEGSQNWQPVVQTPDRERWNDWGIGLLLQGDLKGAEFAFTKVTEAEPGYADGWLNLARALIQEGETERAKPFIARALKIDSSLARVHFFQAMIQKADGDYDGALASLRFVGSKYPRDRVNLNQIGRILFLQKRYGESIEALKKVLQVDPEDVQAHYTLMLAYRGNGNNPLADREQLLFKRFKADESSQAITAKQRLLSPEDNNERQSIHDHESVPLP